MENPLVRSFSLMFRPFSPEGTIFKIFGFIKEFGK